jgi:hypothetical protein
MTHRLALFGSRGVAPLVPARGPVNTKCGVRPGPQRRPLRKSVFPVVLSIFADPEGQKILAGGDNHRFIAKRKPAPEGRKNGENWRGNCPLPPLRGGILGWVVTGGCHHRLISFRASGPPDQQQPFYAKAGLRRGLQRGGVAPAQGNALSINSLLGQALKGRHKPTMRLGRPAGAEDIPPLDLGVSVNSP